MRYVAINPTSDISLRSQGLCFAKRGFGPFTKSDIFVDPKGKNYPEKVVSFTIQTKINLYMFRTQFLVNKKKYIFDE